MEELDPSLGVQVPTAPTSFHQPSPAQPSPAQTFAVILFRWRPGLALGLQGQRFTNQGP